MRKYKSNPIQMGEDITTLMGGGSLEIISGVNGARMTYDLASLPGVGVLVTTMGTYVSELDHRCVELFGIRLTIKPDTSSVYLGRKGTTPASTVGWSYQNDKHGRQQLHPHVYGPILDGVLIDMLEEDSALPLFEHDGHPFVYVKHESIVVRVYLNDIMDVADASNCLLTLDDFTEEHTPLIEGDKYTHRCVLVS